MTHKATNTLWKSKWLTWKTWWNVTLYKKSKNRREFMTLKPKTNHSKQETLLGYMLLPLGSLMQNRREDTLWKMCYLLPVSRLSTLGQEGQWLCISTYFTSASILMTRGELTKQDWEPRGIEHFIVPSNSAQHTQHATHPVEDTNVLRRHPQRTRKPHDYY